MTTTHDAVPVPAKELAELRLDTARLDWLETQGRIGIGHIAYGEFEYYAGGEGFPPIRAAIDAAMVKL